MTSGANGEWVRQGTPRDDNADWNEEQSEYGTALSPTEWDDYSSEQSVPVAAPRAQVPEGTPTAASPGTPSERDPEPVPGQEPDSEEEYRSERTGDTTEVDPIGDADDNVDPVHIDPLPADTPAQSGSTAFAPEPDAPMTEDQYVPEQVEETTRPRPVVPDASATAVGAADPVFADGTADQVDRPETDDVAGHDDAVVTDDDGPMEAAEYLAVDPVPAPVDTFEDEPMADVESPASPARDLSDDAAVSDAEVSGSDDDMIAHEVPEDDARKMGNQSVDEQRTWDADDEMEATQAVPMAVVDADPATTGTIPEGLYRGAGTDPSAAVVEDSYPDVDVEEERLQARLDAERTAREQRLGAVATSSDNAIRDDAGPSRITTDKFFPSLSLFVLRLVTASILGVTSWQILGSGVDATANYLAGFPLIPEPRLVAWILGFTLGALALLLVIGLLQRLVGFVLLVVAVASLTFIRWGNFSIFDAEAAGFLGDKDLLLGAVGLVLLGLGGGRWGIDGAFRASRAASRAEREG